MRNSIYIVEGETEERFFGMLSSNDIIKVGRCRKFNLLNNKLTKKNSILHSYVANIYCILDTDLNQEHNIQTLKFNLRKLKKISSNMYILLQNKNLEDELKKGLNRRTLKEVFNVPNEGDVKTSIIRDHKLLNKLSQHGIDYEKMWLGDRDFKSKIQGINLKYVCDCNQILI